MGRILQDIFCWDKVFRLRKTVGVYRRSGRAEGRGLTSEKFSVTLFVNVYWNKYMSIMLVYLLGKSMK
jgi:hypothetical protein